MNLVFVPNVKQMLMMPKTIKHVVSALHLLNIQSKYMQDFGRKRFIYDMKEMITDYLYRRNFARYVANDMLLVCCNNRLHQVGLSKDCHDCNGTGYYKKNDMYVYFFAVEEIHFIWHQPTENAILPPKISEGQRPPVVQPRYVDLGNTKTEDLMFMVWRFLIQNDYKISLRPREIPSSRPRIRAETRYVEGGAK